MSDKDSNRIIHAIQMTMLMIMSNASYADVWALNNDQKNRIAWVETFKQWQLLLEMTENKFVTTDNIENMLF